MLGVGVYRTRNADVRIARTPEALTQPPSFARRLRSLPIQEIAGSCSVKAPICIFRRNKITLFRIVGLNNSAAKTFLRARKLKPQQRRWRQYEQTQLL